MEEIVSTQQQIKWNMKNYFYHPSTHMIYTFLIMAPVSEGRDDVFGLSCWEIRIAQIRNTVITHKSYLCTTQNPTWHPIAWCGIAFQLGAVIYSGSPARESANNHSDSRERVFIILLHFQRIGSSEIIHCYTRGPTIIPSLHRWFEHTQSESMVKPIYAQKEFESKFWPNVMTIKRSFALILCFFFNSNKEGKKTVKGRKEIIHTKTKPAVKNLQKKKKL